MSAARVESRAEAIAEYEDAYEDTKAYIQEDHGGDFNQAYDAFLKHAEQTYATADQENPVNKAVVRASLMSQESVLLVMQIESDQPTQQQFARAVAHDIFWYLHVMRIAFANGKEAYVFSNAANVKDRIRLLLDMTFDLEKNTKAYQLTQDEDITEEDLKRHKESWAKYADCKTLKEMIQEQGRQIASGLFYDLTLPEGYYRLMEENTKTLIGAINSLGILTHDSQGFIMIAKPQLMSTLNEFWYKGEVDNFKTQGWIMPPYNRDVQHAYVNMYVPKATAKFFKSTASATFLQKIPKHYYIVLEDTDEDIATVCTHGMRKEMYKEEFAIHSFLYYMREDSLEPYMSIFNRQYNRHRNKTPSLLRKDSAMFDIYNDFGLSWHRFQELRSNYVEIVFYDYDVDAQRADPFHGLKSFLALFEDAQLKATLDV